VTVEGGPFTAVTDTEAATDAARDLVRRYYAEVWGAGHPDRCEHFFAPDFTDHDPAGGRGDRQAAIRSIRLLMGSMRDREMEVLHLIAEGDLVAAHWVLRWTQVGRLLGQRSADGRRITLRGHDLYRVRDGHLTDVWHCEDFYGVSRQLAGPDGS
jgi:predicted ester cyclase